MLARKYRRPAEEIRHGDMALRRWRIGDAQHLFAAVEPSLSDLRPWMAWAANDFTVDDARHYLSRTVRQWNAGEVYDYALIVDGRIVGSFGLMKPVIGRVGMSMGYWIATSVTGRGLATRAASLLTETALGLGAELIQIRHHTDNAKSRAIPARLGYRHIGDWDELQTIERGPHSVWQMDSPKMQHVIEGNGNDRD
ncbi:hypothetical protein PWT90_07594 [Aphanocladium album]|nr:hypothetical protein PWT90_07594 [Aphanocladium album]